MCIRCSMFIYCLQIIIVSSFSDMRVWLPLNREVCFMAALSRELTAGWCIFCRPTRHWHTISTCHWFNWSTKETTSYCKTCNWRLSTATAVSQTTTWWKWNCLYKCMLIENVYSFPIVQDFWEYVVVEIDVTSWYRTWQYINE